MLDYTNLTSLNDYKKWKKQYVNKNKYDKKNFSCDFRLKKKDKTKTHVLEELKQNELMTEKHKKLCKASNYFRHFLIFISAICGCVSVSALPSLVGLPVGITRSAIELKICITTAGIKMYNPIIKKKRKKLNQIVLLAKTKLNTVKVLISKPLNGSY